MRLMLCRPVARWKIVLQKYAACVVYTAVLTLFIGLTALVAGVMYRGLGGLFAFSLSPRLFAIYETGPGMLRYLGAMPLLSLALMTFASIGFFFSCLKMKPAAATITTLSLLFFDSIFARSRSLKLTGRTSLPNTCRCGSRYSRRVCPGATWRWTYPISWPWMPRLSC